MPKVSVVMTVRNGERFLQEAVDSILNQTFEDFELIIVNDASTDGTRQILAEYQSRDQRIIIDNLPIRRGVAVCRNLGNAIASGEYIAVMDADDISLPKRLEKQVSFLDQAPDIGLAGTLVEIMNENGKVKSYPQLPTESEVLQWQLFFINPFTHSTIMMRRLPVIALGGYRENIGAAEDYDLYARASIHSKVGIVPEVLVKYRDWGNSLTTRTSKELVVEVNRTMQFLAENFLETPVSEEAVNALRLAAWYQPMEDITQIRKAASLLWRIYNKYKQLPNLSIRERKIIQEDVAAKWYTLARRSLRISFPYAMLLGIRGIITSPFSLTKIVFYYSKKFLRRHFILYQITKTELQDGL